MGFIYRRVPELLVLPFPRCRRPRALALRRGRRPVECFNESLEIEIDGFGKPSRAVARLVVGTGLGAHDAAVDRFAALVACHFQVAEEDQVDHAQHDLAGLVGGVGMMRMYLPVRVSISFSWEWDTRTSP